VAEKYEEMVKRIEKDIGIIIKALPIQRELMGLYPLTAYIKVFATKSPAISTAAATKPNLIYINTEFWRQLGPSFGEKRFVFLHELLHLALRHCERSEEIFRRSGELYSTLFNIAADAVINETLFRMHLSVFKLRPVTMDTVRRLLFDLAKWDVPKSELLKMSTEEIYALLVTACKMNPDKCKTVKIDVWGRGGIGGDIKRPIKPPPGDVIWDGPKSDRPPEVVRSDLERDLRDFATKAAGVGCSGILRTLDELREPKINWRAYLRSAYAAVVGSFHAYTTWARLHRRLPYLYPGYVKFAPPPVYVLIDVSGSIDREELISFATEVYGIISAYKGRTYIICWSSPGEGEPGVWGPFEVRTREDIRRAIEKGKTGGTELLPALRLVKNLKPMPGSFIIIFTDGAIYDIRREETRRLLSELGTAGRTVIMVTTNVKPPLPPNVKLFKYQI